MSDYKLSVIIPTYNSGDFLVEAIDSIKNQSIGFNNVEVIIVDDKSTDEYTINLLNNYKDYPNIKVIFKDKNSGFPGEGRNIGIRNAESDYVIVMDHDDTYVEDAFEVMYNKISSENADLLIATYMNVYNDKSLKPEYVFNKDIDEVEISSIDENPKFFKIGPSIWTKLYRKNFLFENNIKFIEGMLAEDLELFIHSLLCVKKAIYLNNFFAYNYRIRNSANDKSTIHIRNKKYLSAMIDGYFKTWDDLKEFNKEYYFPDVFTQHVVYWIKSFIASDISDNEKIELLEKISPILKKQLEYTPDFSERIYKDLANPILNDDYSKALKVSKKIKKSRKIKESIKSLLAKLH